MKRTRHILSILLPCLAMVMLIFDSKTALQGAQQGLILCGQTVIPALFPFLIVSALLTGTLSNQKLTFLRPIMRFCKMQPGSESLLILGLLGGYPVGAKCVYDLWNSGQISKADAKRCLGFCSNAGPAFIFGMCGMLFSAFWIVWILWGIHIISALLVGHLLPSNEAPGTILPFGGKTSLTAAMTSAITAMLSICGWIVLFRVMIAFGERWFLWVLPANWGVAIEGVLELANGCSSLLTVESEGVRFVICSFSLGLGGLCVGLQTISVTDKLGTGMYFPGKLLQGIISGWLAILFASIHYHLCSTIVPLLIGASISLLIPLKKTVAFRKIFMYNVEKNWKGDFLCYSERKFQNPAAIAPVEQK